ncbi:glycosyltransferase family 2 protein [Bacteroides acidifaciens]|uniref:glycosyltransferase family 2 protein n=1 Tax=Bacteroides acidifaciens TaxID=85831 RepID=UPI0026130F3D|nr:glycosyltransferase family 2 protein [Bacteroides acidifaciens]
MINVSVLVPVYGVEKYIERCARSLFEQTMQDGIEFIFTNDCTKDRSIEILKSVLDEYPHRKTQVKIINHEKNQGLAVSRVTGLNAAGGEYIAHCDSDDWVEPDMYGLMYRTAKEKDADVVVCDFFNEYQSHSKAVSQEFSLSKEDAVLSMVFHNGKQYGYMWNRLVRRDFYLMDKDWKCPESISWGEDIVVTIPQFARAGITAGLERPLYHYNCANTGSMTARLSERYIFSAVNAYAHIKSLLPAANISWQLALDNRIAWYADTMIHSTGNYNPDLWREKFAGSTSRINRPLRQRISKYFIQHKLDKINYVYVKMVEMLVDIKHSLHLNKS